MKDFTGFLINQNPESLILIEQLINLALILKIVNPDELPEGFDPEQVYYEAKEKTDSLSWNDPPEEIGKVFSKRIGEAASLGLEIYSEEMLDLFGLINKRSIVRLFISGRLEEVGFGKGFTDYLLSDKGEAAKWKFYQSCLDWMERTYKTVARELRKLLKSYKEDKTLLPRKEKLEGPVSWDDKRHNIDVLVMEYFDKFGFDFSQALEKLELRNWLKKNVIDFLVSKDQDGITDKKRKWYVKALLLFIKDMRAMSALILPLFQIPCPADVIRRGYLDEERKLKDYRTTQLPILDRSSIEHDEHYWAKKETLTKPWQEEYWSVADKIMFQYWKNLESPLEQEKKLIPEADPYIELYKDLELVTSVIRYFSRNPKESKQLAGAISILGSTPKGEFTNETEAAKKVGLKPDTFRKKLKAIKTHLKMRFPNKVK